MVKGVLDPSIDHIIPDISSDIQVKKTLQFAAYLLYYYYVKLSAGEWIRRNERDYRENQRPSRRRFGRRVHLVRSQV